MSVMHCVLKDVHLLEQYMPGTACLKIGTIKSLRLVITDGDIGVHSAWRIQGVLWQFLGPRTLDACEQHRRFPARLTACAWRCCR